MINITKSTEAPPNLSLEKLKPKSTNYRCEGVLEQLKADFHNKCYLCEEYAPSSINIEHFVPHENNRDLMFDWQNLFFACSHCNNTKLAQFKNILNCCDKNHMILDWIKFEIKPYPKEKVKITALLDNEIVINTVNLLMLIYNGKQTENKIAESENIREKLVGEVAEFGELLRKYFFDLGISEDEKEHYRSKIRKMLSIKSPFTAFKVWIIKENEVLNKEFSQYLPS